MVTYLLDEKGKVDALAAKIAGMTSVLAQRFVVKQWLTLLSHLNDWYSGFSDELINGIAGGVGEAVDHIVRNPQKITDEAYLEVERNMGSDVASAQQVDAELADESNSRHGRASNLNQTNEFPLHYSFVFPTGSQIVSRDDVRNPAILNSLVDMTEDPEPQNHIDVSSVVSGDSNEDENDTSSIAS